MGKSPNAILSSQTLNTLLPQTAFLGSRTRLKEVSKPLRAPSACCSALHSLCFHPPYSPII